MNKGRVEAFTDAVVAIIMTIMVLEFKTPEDYDLGAIISDAPYFFAYLVSFLFIGVAWYNHHYMFALATRITKKTYWVNNFWLLTMSLIPVSTAWVGSFMDKTIPELFYLLVFFFWSLAYLWLSRTIAETLEVTEPERAAKIRKMPPYRFLMSWRFILANLFMGIMIFIYPPSCIFLTLLELIYMAFHTNDDSDQVAM